MRLLLAAQNFQQSNLEWGRGIALLLWLKYWQSEILLHPVVVRHMGKDDGRRVKKQEIPFFSLQNLSVPLLSTINLKGN